MSGLLALALTLGTPMGAHADWAAVQRRTTGKVQTPQIKAKSFYTARIAKTPDINQHMTFEQFLKQLPASLQKKYTPPQEIGLKAKVFFENFCGPCTVADNLMYLRGFFPQMTTEPDPVAGGTFLARNLGFNYFSTVTEPGSEDFDVATGTGTSYVNMVKGTLTYLEEKKIKAKKVTVIGFVSLASERSKYEHKGTPMEFYRRAPTIAEVKTALQLRSIVVQHYGHYEFKANPARAGSGGKARPFLRRTGGHYIAPVGFGLDKNGKQSADTLIYHDPAGSYQDSKKQVFYDWMHQPKSAYQTIPLLNPIGGEPARDKVFVDPNWPRYERYGTLNQTYIMDKTVQNPKENQRYEVMEGLIVIEV